MCKEPQPSPPDSSHLHYYYNSRILKKPSLHMIEVCVFYWKDQNIFVLTDYTQIYSGSIPVVGCLCDMVVLLAVLMELSTLLYVPQMQ